MSRFGLFFTGSGRAFIMVVTVASWLLFLPFLRFSALKTLT